MTRIIQTFTDFGNKKWKDRLKGGFADDKTPDDYQDDDMYIGSKIEREHTSNPDIATEIAMDHLERDPEYYDKLIASGIIDDDEYNDLYDELKGDNYKEKAGKDIIDYLKKNNIIDDDELDVNDEDNDDIDDIDDGLDINDEDNDDFDNYDDEDDIDFEDEDELGSDKSDIKDDELIIDEIKNKNKTMEKNVKNYKSFLKESKNPPEQPIEEQDIPQRARPNENKYKFQIDFDQKIVDKLIEYNFNLYVPEEEKDNATKPTKKTHSIIIDILNLTYSIITGEASDVKNIDASKLKHLLSNL